MTAMMNKRGDAVLDTEQPLCLKRRTRKKRAARFREKAKRDHARMRDKGR